MTDADLKAYRERVLEEYCEGVKEYEIRKNAYLSGFSAGEALGGLLGRVDAYRDAAITIRKFPRATQDTMIGNYESSIKHLLAKIAELLKEKP